MCASHVSRSLRLMVMTVVGRQGRVTNSDVDDEDVLGHVVNEGQGPGNCVLRGVQSFPRTKDVDKMR